MIAQILLLIPPQHRIGPITTLNILHSIKYRCTAHVHLLQYGILQIGPGKLSHLNIREGHIGPLKVTPIDGGIEEARSDEVGTPKVGISHNGLLEGDALEILSGKVGPVEINATGYGYRTAGLESGCSAGGYLGVGCCCCAAVAATWGGVRGGYDGSWRGGGAG